MPGMAEHLVGWTKATEGTLGELGMRIWLNETLKNNDASALAVEGWGGDRFAVFEKGGARLLCWVSDWDTVEDAAKFKSACAKLGLDWFVKSNGAKRVTLTRGATAEQVGVLHKTLAGAIASVPDNKQINLAAVRKNNVKAPSETTGNDLTTLLGKDGNVDVDKLLNDPNIGKLMKEFGGEANGLDMGEMMKNPLIKDMIKQMMSQKAPAGHVSPDGRGYANEELGVSVKMPDSAKEWTLDGKPNVPMAVVGIESPDHAAHIQIISQQMPITMPIETLGPMLEMGFKIGLKDYKKLKEGLIGEGASKGYEFHYTGNQFGISVHMATRFYMRPGKMLVINASTEEGAWSKNEKILMDILNAVKVTEPKVVPPVEPLKE